MTKAIHFGPTMQNTQGDWKQFGTLCGLIGVSEPINPDDVTCKQCRKSQAWAHAVQLWKASQP